MIRAEPSMFSRQSIAARLLIQRLLVGPESSTVEGLMQRPFTMLAGSEIFSLEMSKTEALTQAGPKINTTRDAVLAVQSRVQVVEGSAVGPCLRGSLRFWTQLRLFVAGFAATITMTQQFELTPSVFICSVFFQRSGWMLSVFTKSAVCFQPVLVLVYVHSSPSDILRRCSLFCFNDCCADCVVALCCFHTAVMFSICSGFPFPAWPRSVHLSQLATGLPRAAFSLQCVAVQMMHPFPSLHCIIVASPASRISTRQSLEPFSQFAGCGQAFRRSIGVRIREEAEIIEGEAASQEEFMTKMGQSSNVKPCCAVQIANLLCFSL